MKAKRTTDRRRFRVLLCGTVYLPEGITDGAADEIIERFPIGTKDRRVAIETALNEAAKDGAE